MDVSIQQIHELIRQGEGISTEFKTCRTKINRDVYETVCAFLNRHGGTILLGVQDDGTVQGIEPDAVTQIKKDFVTAINNPLKLTPPTYLSVDAVELDGKSLLRVYVPESSQVHRCNGRIYDRNEDGDLDITDHTTQVAHLYQRKQATFSENKVYPWIQVEDLHTKLIEKCRRYVRINRDNHPWVDMDDLQLLKSAQLYQEDPVTKDSGITLAGVMLFAPDLLILKVCPAHRTDLILRKVNVDRYDDRDLVRTNLIESYDRILAFVQKHLPDPFYLEGIERRSLRDAIFREVASNILIHREYSSGVPARLIIEYGQVTTWNANRPHGFGVLNPDTFAPYPKNPVIGAFFREIDRADELGSGMRKMMMYGKKYGGADPQLIEGDVFRMIISVPEFSTKQEETVDPSQVRVHDGVYDGVYDGVHDTGLTETMKKILVVLVEPKSTPQLLAELGYPRRTRNYEAAIKNLLDFELIEMTLPDKPRSKNQRYRQTEKGNSLMNRTS